jgi:hypothetical protein
VHTAGELKEVAGYASDFRFPLLQFHHFRFIDVVLSETLFQRPETAAVNF